MLLQEYWNRMGRYTCVLPWQVSSLQKRDLSPRIVCRGPQCQGEVRWHHWRPWPHLQGQKQESYWPHYSPEKQFLVTNKLEQSYDYMALHLKKNGSPLPEDVVCHLQKILKEIKLCFSFWILFIQWCFLSGWIDINPLVLQKKICKCCRCMFPFWLSPSFENDMVLHLNKLQLHHTWWSGPFSTFFSLFDYL